MNNYTSTSTGATSSTQPSLFRYAAQPSGGCDETLSPRANARLAELRQALRGGQEAVGLIALRDDAHQAERNRREHHATGPEPGLVLRLKKRQEAETLTSVDVYLRDVQVKRKRQQTLSRAGGGTRAKIRDFSARSARELLFRARNVEGLTTMMTLTYPGEFPTDGRKVKRDWAALRRWLVHRGLGGLWWLEFQQRGAPHLHVYVNGRVELGELAKAWYRIVDSGDPRHLVAGTRVETIRNTHAVGAYAAKYTHKAEQKEVPPNYQEVGRFWGLFGGVKVLPVVQVEGCSDRLNEETGELVQVGGAAVQAVRVVRQVYRVNRRENGLRPPRKDKGKHGFRAWDIGPSVRGYLERVGALGNTARIVSPDGG